MDTVLEFIYCHPKIQELLIYESTETAQRLLKLFFHYRFDITHLLKTGLKYDVANSTEPTLFRSSTTGIVLVLDYVKYIQDKFFPTIKLLINKILKYNKPIEINEMYMSKKQKYKNNLNNLKELLDECLIIISEGIPLLPGEFSTVLHIIAEESNKRFDKAGLKFVTSVFFMRFFCQILSVPSSYFPGMNLTDNEQRNLILVSKSLQAVANGCTNNKDLSDYAKHNNALMANSVASLIFRNINQPLCCWIPLNNDDLKDAEQKIGLTLLDLLQLSNSDRSIEICSANSEKSISQRKHNNCSRRSSLSNCSAREQIITNVNQSSTTEDDNENSQIYIDEEDEEYDYEEEEEEDNSYDESYIEYVEDDKYKREQLTRFKLKLSDLNISENTGLNSPHIKVRQKTGNSLRNSTSSSPILTRWNSNKGVYQKGTPPNKRDLPNGNIPVFKRRNQSLTHNLLSPRPIYKQVKKLNINHLSDREILMLNMLLINSGIINDQSHKSLHQTLINYQSRYLNDNAIIWTNRYLINWIKRVYDINANPTFTDKSLNKGFRKEIIEFVQLWKLDGWDFVRLNKDQLNYMQISEICKSDIFFLVNKLKDEAIVDIQKFYARKGKLSSWSNEDVIIWLLLSNMDQYIPTFKQYGIQGSDLDNISPNHLRKLGVTRIQDQMKIKVLR